ncbi:DUF5522 domain-containing protein [Fulvivirga sedimenti]|uniref:DUF5522 domain-containing protein n=1 Tax=Fulvivirga sedimenti TaxID=2879465 RepID=A0A9X1HSC7_9BACT|nr:DUF5522 domain-containing protein [Fulvivirga sedimenti]MCA6074521.1 DUF5522 domain-containing protein [Fulvivirga sedimenti]MCA6075698.1 DUF5522 domain-containing protein [Fulvivirga sedimenti]MCA6076826.1 DUF5522 domain-containing protein [Fulvivirga sedimenti]
MESKPAKGRDYYIENGNLVFTEEYLRRRGFCCGSGCRHCPYDKPPQRRSKPENPWGA